MPPPEPDDEVVIPALLRGARGCYAQAIRVHLEARGLDDMPRNGSFVLGGMAHHGGSAADMIGALGISKQAASQLIDTLVSRGYLTRRSVPDDRRRVMIELTERGRAAAVAVRDGIADVDTELATMLSPRQLAGLRAGLAALIDIKQRTAEVR